METGACCGIPAAPFFSPYCSHISMDDTIPPSPPLDSPLSTPPSSRAATSNGASSPLHAAKPASSSSGAQRTYHRQSFFVEVPYLSDAQKSDYRPSSETLLNPEMDIDVDEVIGEYKEGHSLYYFARYREGIAHKVRESGYVHSCLGNAF
jgi:hypothetical protein